MKSSNVLQGITPTFTRLRCVKEDTTFERCPWKIVEPHREGDWNDSVLNIKQLESN